MKILALTYRAHSCDLPQKWFGGQIWIWRRHSGSGDAEPDTFPDGSLSCHVWQLSQISWYDGPSKNGQTKLNQIQSSGGVQSHKAASHPMSSHCPVQTKLLLSSNLFHDSLWWIYAAFFASACHQTRCIYANCELSVREMYRWRLSANESLARSTPWDRVLQTCNEPTRRRLLCKARCE